jgi:hypothetical protein
MQGLSFKCLIHGHDDRVRRTTTRLYLECAECGRETHGWAFDERTSKAGWWPLTRRGARLFDAARDSASSLRH